MENNFDQLNDGAHLPNQQIKVRIKALKPPAVPTEEVVASKQVEISALFPSEISEDKKSSRGRKSLKTIEIEADLIDIPPDEVLFSKQYYSIREVAQMFRENTSVFRYWEKEFDILQPKKNKKGDRFYRPNDIKNLELIYDLLRRRKLTIDGAKAVLKEGDATKRKFEMIQSLQEIKNYLLEIKANL